MIAINSVMTALTESDAERTQWSQGKEEELYLREEDDVREENASCELLEAEDIEKLEIETA